MEPLKNSVVGFDLDTDRCYVSFCKKDGEPEMLKSKSGKEEIPLLVGFHHGKWYCGRSAKRLEIVKEGFTAGHLVERALKNQGVTCDGHTYSGRYLLAQFLRQILRAAGGGEKLVFALKTVNENVSRMLRSVLLEMGYDDKNITVMDYEESFSNYMFYQPRELWQYETALFDFRKGVLSAHRLKRLETRYEKKGETFVTAEKVAEAKEAELLLLGEGDMDKGLLKFVRGVLAKRTISSVYLAGEGFKGDGFEETLTYLGNGRRVFVGNNLYSKGAVLTESRESRISFNNPVYLNDEKMNEQISIRLTNEGQESFVPVVPFGTHWYEADEKFDVIALDNTPVEIKIESLLDGNVRNESVSLENLTVSRPYGSRLEVGFRFMSDKILMIHVKDVTSGLLGKSTGFETEKEIRLGGTYGQFNSLSH